MRLVSSIVTCVIERTPHGASTAAPVSGRRRQRLFGVRRRSAYGRYLGANHPDADRFVANNLAVDWERELSWVVSLDGEPVGSIFIGVDPQDSLAELACLLAPHVWRRGIASEAARAVVAHAFDDLGIEKVFARAAAANVSSRRAMEKAGMIQEGLLRAHRVDRHGGRADEVMYGMTREDWRRLREVPSTRVPAAFILTEAERIPDVARLWSGKLVQRA